MSYYYLWMIVEIALLILNIFILNKYQEKLTYQKWVDVYFWVHKITTAIPGIMLVWGGYIFLFDFFNSYEYYKLVFVRELTILSGYFVIFFLLLYLSENARKIYVVVRAALLALNIYQIYFLVKFSYLLNGFDIPRNIYRGGQTSGTIIIVLWALIEIVNCLVFIYYYKYNRYEMTN